MRIHQSVSENQISRILVKNWSSFFPHLHLIGEKFKINGETKDEWNEIDILAFNKYKKRFSIVEIKKGRSKNQLVQANRYKALLQEHSLSIYERIESEFEEVTLPEFSELSEPELILIAESFSENLSLVINKNLWLAEYTFKQIDENQAFFLLNYIGNKPPKLASRVDAIIQISTIKRELILRKSERNPKLLRVVFPDGVIFYSDKSITTFIESVRKIGLEKVLEIDLKFGTIQLIVSDIKQVEKSRRDKYLKVERFYLYKHHSTKAKEKLLNSISEKLKIPFTIETVTAPNSISNTGRQMIKRKKDNLIKKILSLTESEVAGITEEERIIISQKLGL